MGRGALTAAVTAVTLLSLPAAALGATIPVGATDDESGNNLDVCALREAIVAANTDTAVGGCPAGAGPDTVLVPAGIYLLTLDGYGDDTGQFGDLDVNDTLTLTGAGPALTVIDAGSTSTAPGGISDRVLDVHSNRTATVEGLTIRGGLTRDGTNSPAVMGPPGSGQNTQSLQAAAGDGGGGVRNAGLAVLRNVVVTGNTTGDGGTSGSATGGSGGPGAAGGLGGASFGGNGGPGGGILTTGLLTLENSVVSANRTGDGGNGGLGVGGPGGSGAQGGFGAGGSAGFGGDGGGVAQLDPGELTIVGSTISGNVTGTGGNGGVGVGGAGGNGGNGGAARFGLGGSGGNGGEGGGVSGTSSIVLSTITENTTGAGGRGGNALGGTGGTGTVGNGGAGANGSAGSGGDGGDGGGVTGQATISGTTIADNATGLGGNGGRGDGGSGGDGAGGFGGNGGNANPFFGGDGGDGGGVFMGLGAAISDSTLTDNATGGGGNGGAVGTPGPGGQGGAGAGASGSSIGGDGGDGGNGGALSGADLTRTATNVTVAGNSTGAGGNGTGDRDGGRGGNGSAIHSLRDTLALVHGTVIAGTLGAGGAGATPGAAGAGAIAHDGGASGTLSLRNTIVLGSCAGTITDAGGNLQGEGDAAPCPGAGGDPLLGPLADNGGPTETRALGPGSAALDAVPAAGAGCVATDQRGATRPGGAACDVGAYEVAPPSAVTGPAEAVQATSARLTATIEPRGLATTYRFELGTTTAYGSSTPVQVTAASGAPVQVSADVTGLAPETVHHFRVVAVGPDGTATGADVTFETLSAAPVLSRVSVSPKRFAVSGRATPLTAQRRVALGTTLRFTLSEPATVAIAVQRRTTGLKVRRRGRTRCVRAAPRRLRQAPRRSRCKLFVKAGRSLRRAGVAGANRVAFSGRIGRKALRLGPHRMRIVATGRGGNRSAARTASFTVVRASR